MAGLDLSMLFDPDCDPHNLPLAAGVLHVSDESVERPTEPQDASIVVDHDNIDKEVETVVFVDQDGNKIVMDEDSTYQDSGLGSPPKQNPMLQTSTPVPNTSAGHDRPIFSESTIPNFIPTPSTSDDRGSLSQVSHVSNTPSTPTTSILNRSRHPIGWSMPKRRNGTILNTSSSFVARPVPNYRVITQRNQPYPQARVNHGQPDVSHPDVPGLAYVLGATNNLPNPDVADNSPIENPAEAEKLNNTLKQMLEKGDISSWEELEEQFSYVRSNYAKNDDAQFFHDRLRVQPRMKATYESLYQRPGEHDYEETPELLKKELKKHQKSALKFMLWRETQDPPGGILADDMGLGKTLTVIALIAATLKVKLPIDTPRPRGIKYIGNTLIVCPPNLTNQWAEEFSSGSRCIRVFVHHGLTKALKVEDLILYDVVITSYNIATNEQRNGECILYKVLWNRIVLDEGHFVRNFQTQVSEAMCKLTGKMRWILTGTPIHNRIDDLYPYLVFLKVHPFDERQVFLKWAKDRQGHGRLNVILKALMIRRTKDELKTISTEKNVECFEYELEEKEAECYKRLMIMSQAMMKIFLNHRARRNGDDDIYLDKEIYQMQQKVRKRMNGYVNINHIFVLLLRLRQLCAHPVLISSMLTKGPTEPTEEEEVEYGETDLDIMGQIIDDTINDKDIFNVKNEIFNEERASTKINMLLNVLEKRFLPTNDKAIIVCEWTSFLDIISDHLSLLGLSYEFYTGKVDMKERPEVLKRFNSDCMHPRVLLLSLQCGGIGLNLARANHIFLMCTHWNPQMELQAQDRAYRIGQEKDVHIYKFRAQGTIEERIFNLQQEKLKLAQKMLDGASSNNYRLTIQDLKTLFGL